MGRQRERSDAEEPGGNTLVELLESRFSVAELRVEEAGLDLRVEVHRPGVEKNLVLDWEDHAWLCVTAFGRASSPAGSSHRLQGRLRQELADAA